MKYLRIAVAVIFIFGSAATAAGLAAAQCGKCGADKAKAAKEIVTDDPEELSDDKEFGVGSERETSEEHLYDEDTGLPDVVPSDRAGELE